MEMGGTEGVAPEAGLGASRVAEGRLGASGTASQAGLGAARVPRTHSHAP
jgi:hypothetical protein